MAIKSIFNFGKKRSKRRSKRSTKKPSKTLIRKCIRLKIKVTVRRGRKRVYKSTKLLKKLLSKKLKTLKRKTRFGLKGLVTGSTVKKSPSFKPDLSLNVKGQKIVLTENTLKQELSGKRKRMFLKSKINGTSLIRELKKIILRDTTSNLTDSQLTSISEKIKKLSKKELFTDNVVLEPKSSIDKTKLNKDIKNLSDILYSSQQNMFGGYKDSPGEFGPDYRDFPESPEYIEKRKKRILYEGDDYLYGPSKPSSVMTDLPPEKEFGLKKLIYYTGLFVLGISGWAILVGTAPISLPLLYYVDKKYSRKEEEEE